MVTSTGKISVSRGYYNDGTIKHYFSETEKTFDEATTGQTKGCKNNLFAVIDNGVSDIAVCAGAIAGNPDWSVELPTKIYTDPTKSYILGTEPLKDIDISYQNESSSINFSVVGSVTVTNNIAEGFNSSSYIELPDLFNHDGKSWEILIKFKVSSLGARRKLNGSHSRIDHLFPEIEIDSSNRFSLSIPTETGNGWQLYWTDTNAISANKWYWAKLSCSSSYVFTFEVSEDGNTYTTLKTHNGTKVYQSPYTMAIGTDIHASSGILPLTNGQIDLSESYIKIDGEYWWKALKETPASIKTASTGFVYKAPNTYNYPETLEIPATSFTEQLGDVNDILYTNTAGSYRSSLMPIAVGQTPQGTYSSYAKSSSKLCRAHGSTEVLGTEPTYEASLISGNTPNYSIVGSPTITDGVVSNFSGSNYIQLPEVADFHSADSWEFKTKVTVGSTNTNQKICYISGLNFGITSGGYLHIWLRNGNNSSWLYDTNIVSASSMSNPTWIKVTFTGSQFSVSTSSDGSNYTVKWSASNSTKIANASSNVDIGNNSGEYWRGSIDLKETQISLNGSVFWKAYENKIQRFTVTGTPTISSGVISGLSSSNYIVASQQLLSGSARLDDHIVNITVGSTTSTLERIWGPVDDAAFGLFMSSGKLVFKDRYSTYTGSLSLQSGSKYWVWTNIIGGYVYVHVAPDNGTYTVETLPSPVESPALYTDNFGDTIYLDFFKNHRYMQYGGGDSFSGSIDLNKTKFRHWTAATGDVIWRPYEEVSGLSISESGWTGLDTSIAGTRGAVSFNRGTSSVKTFDDYFGHALAPSVRNYLWLVSYPSNAIADSSMNLTSLPSSTDGAAFTGYVVSTNSSRNAFESLEKIGTLCKAFYNSTSNLWVVIPVNDMQEGTFTATYYVASKDISATGSLPPVEASQAGTAEMTYDVTNETLEVVSTIFNFKGDLYFDLTNN